jgi:type I restriction enzyme M protein
MMMNKINLKSFVKCCSDILRSEYSPHDYHKIILPFLCGEESVVKKEIKIELKSLICRYNVETLDLGDLFECFLTYFAENTTAEFYTPEDIRKLTIDLVNMQEVKSIYDPTCGTGGFLSTARHKYPNSRLFGQELNPDTAKISRMYLGDGIECGNTLTEDLHADKSFDLILSNPPFGLDWKKYEKTVKADKRFEVGHPRTSDGSMLFLLHCISKLSKTGKLGIVLNASPLFTGDAGSGESEIRRWIIENDLLEAIIALPDQLFYNTGISTYIWILSNRKSDLRKSKIRLINGASYFEKLRKSLGNKRNVISDKNREDIVKLYSMIEPHEDYIEFDNTDFGYHKITVNSKTNGKDTERVPLKEDIKEYFAREVLPHVPDAQIAEKKTKIGYEIPFTRHFYKFTPLRKSEDILAEIKELQEKINAEFDSLSCIYFEESK